MGRCSPLSWFGPLVYQPLSSCKTESDRTPKTSSLVLGDPARCNRANAKPLTFDEAVRNATALNGKCVAIEGFWATRALFGRAQDANRRKSNFARALRRKRIGIYGRDELLDRSPKRATRSTMIGVLGQCETEWPEAVMVMGYCHYSGGPIIKVAEAISTPTRNVR